MKPFENQKKIMLEVIDTILGPSAKYEYPFNTKTVEIQALKFLKLEKDQTIKKGNFFRTIIAGSCYLQYLQSKESGGSIIMKDVKEICAKLKVKPIKVVDYINKWNDIL